MSVAAACDEPKLDPVAPLGEVVSDAGASQARAPLSDEAAERAGWRSRHEALRGCPAVAAPVAFRTEANPAVAIDLLVGDGWGCATLHDNARYCWLARGQDLTPGTTIVARHVAWLDDKRLTAGPDRICLDEIDGIRCRRAPEFLTKPVLNGGLHADTGENDGSSWRLPRLGLGEIADPTPVTHGAWRGCSTGLCWGPSDATTAAPTPVTICYGGRLAAPCEVASAATLREFDQTNAIGDAMIGDLFACLRTMSGGLLCLGASRDGLFGASRECPPELFRAWPTATGPVAAPNAKCSRKPVRLGPTHDFGNRGSASPRGLCLEDMRLSTAVYPCHGAISAPKLAMAPIVMGLGDEPSACGIDSKGQVYCWGAGYSQKGGSPTLVPIRLETPTESTVAWQGHGPFHANCGIHRNCTRTTQALPACSDNSRAIGLDQLFLIPEGLEGEVITVRGALVLATVSSPQVGVTCCPCRPGNGPGVPDVEKGGGSGNFCCLEARGPLAVANGLDYLVLAGLECSGDLSRLCCNLPVLGQTVVATGKLSWSFAEGVGRTWTLAEPQLCEPKP